MRTRLQQAGLWQSEEGEWKINITSAWKVLSRIGFPARFGGKAQDGSYEYFIINPNTGGFFATGKGATLERAMCEAALNARALIDTAKSSNDQSGFTLHDQPAGQDVLQS